MVIADDSECMRDLLEHALSRIEKVEVVGLAENGAAAIEIIDQTSPDLLVLDLHMPVKSGLEVLKDLNQREDSPLVVVFTADSSVTVRENCLRAGAGHYFEKTQLGDLKDLCKQILAVG